MTGKSANSFELLQAKIRRMLETETGTFAIAFIDLNNGLNWNLNSRPMRAASLIKIFILIEVFEQILAAQLDPSDSLAFGEQDRVAGAGLLQQLLPGTHRSILELIELMITESDNIATNLLIARVSEDKVNARIQRLGCADSVLRRRMMDFAAAAAGQENLTSVADVAKVLALMHQELCVSSDIDRQMGEILGRQTDRCKIPLLLPTEAVCRNKTGELPGAEHDAGIIQTKQGSYVLVVMSDELADPERGCQLIAKISREFYDWFIATE